MSRQSVELENDQFQVSVIRLFDERDGAEQLLIERKTILTGETSQIRFNSGSGFHLCKKTGDDASQTVKLIDAKLIIALYSELLCFDL